MKYSFLLVASVLSFVTVFAQEPATQPTNLVFNNVTQYSFGISFTNNGSGGYLVVKGTAPITFVPVDGTTYQKGQGVTGNAKVVSVNTATGLNLREILENTTYYIAIFAFNGSGVNINYKSDNPLSGSVTSLPAGPDNYYGTLDSMGPNFINQLHSLITAHTVATYSGYKTTVVPVIYERDTTGGQYVVNCDYSNETKLYTPPFDFVDLDYSREHCMPRSWMPTGGITSNPDGADHHNLLLTRLASVNSVRSNYPYGEVVNPTTTYLEGKLGYDSNGDVVYEPKESVKGDVARAQFYQMVCYNGNNGSWGYDFLPSDGPDQDQSVLRQWHLQDPPDKFELTKHTYIFTLQDNRNPFIDHPGWVDCINFDSLNKRAQCINVSVRSIDNNLLSATIYPNPSGGNVSLQIALEKASEAIVIIYDLTGRAVMSLNTELYAGLNNVQLSTDNLPAGNYVLSAQTNSGRYTAKLVRF